MYQFGYFIWATWYGFQTLKDAAWFPAELGGSGSWNKMTEGAPFVPIHEGAIKYAMLQLGYHGGDLVHHIFVAERQNDFFEMLMHHIAAAGLIFIMCYGNMLPLGLTIAYIHDISDITVTITKGLGQTNYTVSAVVWFIIHMFVWGYFRNYLLVKYVYFLWTDMIGSYPPEYDQYNWVPFGAMLNLCGLVFLHYYWYMLFIQILLFYKKNGKAEDL
jgi:hypothetical protein